MSREEVWILHFLITSGALVQCISQRKNCLHNPFQLDRTPYLRTSRKTQEMYDLHYTISKFELISSADLFCRRINNAQVPLKVRNLKIVREKPIFIKAKQNSTVRNSKNRNQLPHLRTELNLK